MFVGFTRVTNSMFLRVWPALEEDLNLERFLKEKHDLALVLFDQAYDVNGYFQDSLYMAAYQRHLDAEIVNSGGTVQSNRQRNQSMNINDEEALDMLWELSSKCFSHIFMI
jgi:hypothetical protein